MVGLVPDPSAPAAYQSRRGASWNFVQQFSDAELIDGSGIHLVPVRLGSGTRLFDALRIDHRELQLVSEVDIAHLRFTCTTVSFAPSNDRKPVDKTATGLLVRVGLLRD